MLIINLSALTRVLWTINCLSLSLLFLSQVFESYFVFSSKYLSPNPSHNPDKSLSLCLDKSCFRQRLNPFIRTQSHVGWLDSGDIWYCQTKLDKLDMITSNYTYIHYRLDTLQTGYVSYWIRYTWHTLNTAYITHFIHPTLHTLHRALY